MAFCIFVGSNTRAGAPAPHFTFTFPLPLLERDPVLGIGWADVVSAGTDEAVVVELFDHVGGPSADSRYGEHRGEEVHINSEGVVSRGRIKVDVGVELLFGLHE